MFVLIGTFHWSFGIGALVAMFTPLEIMPRCSAAGLDFRIIPAGFNAPLEFLMGFTGLIFGFSGDFQETERTY